MDELIPEMPMYSSETTTTTIVGVSNLAVRDYGTVPESVVMSYTVPSDNMAPSRPLSDDAVRVGNSLLDAHVTENAILRDCSEDI